jgi:hypothetical protein
MHFLILGGLFVIKKKDNNSLIHQKTLENNELEIYVLSERIK